MRVFWSNAFTLVVVTGVLGVGAVAAGKIAYTRPGPLEAARVVTVEKGASLGEVAERLADDGVVSSASLFVASARVLGLGGAVKAGDYEIAARASMADVLDALTDGRAVEHRVTVAEGLTVAEIAALVTAEPVLVGAIERLPAEGMLAPDTYFVRRGDTRQAVIDRMARAQEQRLAQAWAARAEGLPFDTPEQALVLASIIEKETGVGAERREVSSVFVNRLRKGMKLQSDPTVIYGLTGGAGPLGRELTRADWKHVSAHNTYVIDGLPPTPIANPGLAAIEAALTPADTDYLYFVADGSGGHAFARTLDEHNRNVSKWRAFRRSQSAAGGG